MTGQTTMELLRSTYLTAVTVVTTDGRAGRFGQTVSAA